MPAQGNALGTNICKNGVVYALNAATGEPVWVYDSPTIPRDWGSGSGNIPRDEMGVAQGNDACCMMTKEHMTKPWMNCQTWDTNTGRCTDTSGISQQPTRAVAVAELRSEEVAEIMEASREAAEEAPPKAPVEFGGYAVQLGAYSDVTGARRIADRAEAEGFSVRMVRVWGSELVRVRIGRFENQEDALELLRRVKAGGFEVALVTDAAHEDPIA